MRGIHVGVVTSSGLPVLGQHTAIEKQLFAEVDTWQKLLRTEFEEIETKTLIDLAQTMQANGDNSDITQEQVYNLKMQHLFDFANKKDKYGLGWKVICLIVHGMQDSVALQTQTEFDTMSRLMPRLQLLADRQV